MIIRGIQARRRVLAAGIVAVALGLLGPMSAAGQDNPAASPTSDAATGSNGLATHVVVLVNKSVVLSAKGSYRRVSIGQPDVADVNLLGPGNLLVTGKKPGTTQIIVWDDAEHSQIFEVTVRLDVETLRQEIQQMFPSLKLEVRTVNGTVAIRGTAPSLAVAEQVMQTARQYSKDVLNLMEISGGKQVMLRVRFAEVSRTATSSLGVNLASANGSWSGGSQIGGVNPTNLIPQAGQVGATPAFDGIDLANSPTTVAPAVTLYGAAQAGSFFLEYFIDALRENNLLRILAEPNVMAISGQEASFLAGGEYPIPVAQSASGGTTPSAITVEYKEYGIKLKFTPVVLGDGKIRLKVAPEVSELDYTNGVTISGFRIPALTERGLTTTVELGDGQTLALAGLLDNEVSATKDVTPLLGDVPILGALFRSVQYQRQETELVVLVTPQLVEPLNPASVPALPGEYWRHPTENELFYNQDLGGETAPPQRGMTASATPGPAPLFHGEYGFVPAGTPKGSVASIGKD